MLDPVFALLAGAAPGAAADFRDEVNAAHVVAEPVCDANHDLLRDGKIEESNQALLALFPEETRTAAQAFMLGNLLFSLDPARSYVLHKQAYELAPTEAMTQYEWALERHRRREYAEAEVLYAGLEGGEMAEDPRIPAFRADCLLHTGKYAEAVAEWKKADPRNRHTSIEQGFSWIYGGPNPCVARGALLAKVRAGDVTAPYAPSAIEELILLDLEWETDWWNSRPKAEYLALDLPLAAEKLGADSSRYRALALLAELTPKDDLARPDPIRALKSKAPKLNGRRVVGADVPLAENSRVAANLLHLAQRNEVATPAELLAWYEKPLRQLAEADPGDARSLETLAALYEKAERPDEELAALEELGWKKFGAPECLCGVLWRKETALKSDDPLLKEALAKFPENTKIRRFALDCAQREEKGEKEAVAALLAAYLAHLVSWNEGAQPGFIALEELLAK